MKKHRQYICGSCGRCICIEADVTRNLQRWNFPFKSLEIAKLYLRTADYTMNTNCGIYEIENNKGRRSYKIFVDDEQLRQYLNKNQDKKCLGNKAKFRMENYIKYPKTKVRSLSSEEIIHYLEEDSDLK